MIFMPSLEVESLQGSLTDDRRINATGLLLKEAKPGLNKSNKTRIVSNSECWTISGPRICSEASVVFDIVNFCFDGTEVEEQVVNGQSSLARSLMTLLLGGREVQLRQIPGYDQAVATLRAQRSVQVTCTATVTVGSLAEIDEVEAMMDTLCDVMSVARGTLVSWTSFEVHAADGVSPYSRYRNAVTRRYAGTEPISGVAQHDTKRFLEEGFQKCGEMAEEFQVRKIARAFVETRGGSFLESRGLLIAVLVEYLANVRARLEGSAYLLESKKFKAGLKLLRCRVRAALTEVYPNVEDEQMLSMLESVNGLNRRPLRQKLDSLAAWLEISFDKEEKDFFVKARNKLAHEGILLESDTAVESYFKMQSFLDRIVLRLFGYHGTYYDFAHRAVRKI
jgi:hypothetical protein